MENAAAPTQQTWYKNYFWHDYLAPWISMATGISGKKKKKNEWNTGFTILTSAKLSLRYLKKALNVQWMFLS